MADESKNTETPTNNQFVSVTKPGFTLTFKPVVLILAASIAYLLVVCLISGLVFRDINICKADSGAQVDVTTKSTVPTPTTTTTTTNTPTTTTNTPTTTTMSPITTITTVTTPTSTQTTPTTPTTRITTTTTTATTSSSTSASTTASTTSSTSTGRTVTLTSQSTTTTQSSSGNIYENLRLPDIYEPINYNLKIHFFFSPDLKSVDDTTFDGLIDMTFNLKKDTREILFHVDPQIQVLSPIIIVNTDTLTQVLINTQRPVINEYYYITTNTTLTTGKYIISVPFLSQYRSLYENRGVFALRYLDELNER